MFVSHMNHGRGFLRGMMYSTALLFTVTAVPALACSITVGTDKWASVNGLTEADAVEGQRYQGLCGLVAPVSAPAYAVDDNPVDETLFIGRFWFFVGNLTSAAGNSVTMYSLLNGTTSQMDLVVQNSGGNLQLVAETPGGNSTPITIANTAPYAGWHVVDFTYQQSDSGAGSVTVQLDKGASQQVTGLTNSPITDAWLGVVSASGASGTMRFDSYVSQRSGVITPLVKCDANDDGNVDPGDVLRANAEVADLLPPPGLADGQPDCNGDGSVNPGDVLYINAIVNNLVADPNASN